MNRSTDLLRNIFYWLFVPVFVLAAGFYLPHIAGFAALITVALLLPIRRWQRLVEKVVRGNAKIILTIAMAVFTFGIAPVNKQPAPKPPEDPPSIATTTGATVSTTAATTTTTAATVTTVVKETFVLNTNTKKFHRPDCRYASDITEDNKRSFHGERDNLITQGYSPCGSCKP